MALYRILSQNCYEVSTLFTVIDGETGRIPMHEVHLGLLQRQCQCLGVPLTVVTSAQDLSAEEYGERMSASMQVLRSQGIGISVFGDIYLEELKRRREENCRRSGMQAVFPLWKYSGTELMREFINLGFRAVITSVDESVLDRSYIGRTIDREFLLEYPKTADLCGENGEYHSFVYDGPIFREPAAYQIAEIYSREYPEAESGKVNRYWYATLCEK